MLLAFGPGRLYALRDKMNIRRNVEHTQKNLAKAIKKKRVL